MSDLDFQALVQGIVSGELTGAQACQVIAEAGPAYTLPAPDPATDMMSVYIAREDRARALVAELESVLYRIDEVDASSLRAVGDAVIAGVSLISSSPAGSCVALGRRAMRLGEVETAIHFFTRGASAGAGRDPFVHCLCAGFLVGQLITAHRYSEVPRWLDVFTQSAQEQGLNGQLSLAMRFRALLLDGQGRAAEAHDAIRAAIELRGSLTPDEARDEEVRVPEAAFHSLAGRIARRLGRIDDSVAAYQRAYELFARDGDQIAAATALSDIGFTYLSIDEVPRADVYLGRAAALARQHGRDELADRWIREVSRKATPAVDLPQGSPGSSADAYSRMSDITARLRHGHRTGLLAQLRGLIDWAEDHHDLGLELTARSNLANLHDLAGQLFQAVLRDRSAAHLARRNGDLVTWLSLRANLANRYIRFGNEGCTQAGIVIRDALDRVEGLLDSTAGAESRQLIQGSAQRLHQDMVFLHLVKGDCAGLLSAAEHARARNTAGWIAAQRVIDQSALNDRKRELAQRQLQRLRAVDTEAEAYALGAELAAERLETLGTRREQALAGLTDLLADDPDLGAAVRLARGGRAASWEETREVLSATPDAAVLYLFCLPEGVVAVVLRATDVTPPAATLIPWTREERLRVLRRWSGPMVDGRGGDGLRLDESLVPFARTEADSERALRAVRDKFVSMLVPLFGDQWPARLAVVPHRELQLLPWHELFLPLRPDMCLTLAPSLQVLTECLRRSPTGSGSTVVVRDQTGTLDFPEREAELARRRGRVAEPRSLDELVASLETADLFHAAAHGVFDPDNPFRSGLVVFTADKDGPPPFTVGQVLSRVRMTDCSLVILSACESGLARQHAADEHTGLPGALLIAGAKAVIATQWPVRDDAALVTIGEFLRRWSGSGGTEPSPARALHEAKAAIRTMPREEVAARLGTDPGLAGQVPFQDPAYTAAFQVFGAW
jgi:tetratricopeptide (TPR) repeat protein